VAMMNITEIGTGLSSLLFHKIGEPILFSSWLFWVMFIGFILIYSLVYKRKAQMMLYVAAFSLVFYYLCNGMFFLLLPFTALVDWFLALRIHATEKRSLRRLYLTISICLSLGILIYFKYTNFFIHTWNNIFTGNFQLLDLFLPVGISFYTFQTISYVTDVYRKRIEPTTSFLQYVFFISFFPLILAGPIMRAEKFFPQIREDKKIIPAMVYGGLWLVMLGILKKAVFADYIAQYNNWIFEDPTAYSGFEGLMGVIGYSAQIYCDFSGYSDMSIGVASIMGFDLGKNFNFPYQARNLSDFWRRWHISLSTWMRDYIYIPLGGNRTGKFRMYFNNMATMLIAGLWHGASWMFVIWGAGHGIGLIIQKLNKPWLDKLPDNFIVRFLSWLLTFIFVTFLWIFFRSTSMETSIDMITNIWTRFDLAYALPFWETRTTWCIFIFLIFLMHGIRPQWYDRLKNWFIAVPWVVKLLLFVVTIQLVLQFQTGNVQPFIYFQF